ncbi:MAG: DJ-1/PfpI family protein [Lachnospiraceae bacterium]|nr:DJ-1/PfpI family protein [Lachnospiraceae bacterium]
MSRIAMFLADGFEEIEGLTSVDMCRRAGIEVVTVSVMDELLIKGSHGINVYADEMFGEGKYDGFDMLVLPGGGLGTKNLEEHAKVLAEVKKAHDAGRFIAAICAAPRIIGRLGFLEGKKATCYPGNEEHLKGAEYLPQCKAVTDGKMITARGMGAAMEFGKEIITALEGKEKAEEIMDMIRF